MTLVEKAQSFIILAAVFAGLILGSVPWAQQHAARLIVPLLMLMLTGVFLHVPLKGFADVFQYRSVAFVSLGINFIWTPLLAWLLGWLFLADHPALRMGFLMLMVTPCTDWYLVFTGIARGNLALSTALLPVNLILQLLLLPVFILLLAGTVFTLAPALVLESVLLMLILPFLAANSLRHFVVRFKSRDWLERRLLPAVSPAQIILLALAIMAVFASEGRAVAQNPQMLLHLLPPLALFFTVNLLLSFAVSKWLGSGYENFVSLSFTTLARNSPIALAIALVAFPDKPLVAIALVIGPLIELPALALVSQILLWIGRKGFFYENSLCPGWKKVAKHEKKN
ncbi:MAG: arsenic resistance protein [Desulfobacterales bacterium]